MGETKTHKVVTREYYKRILGQRDEALKLLKRYLEITGCSPQQEKKCELCTDAYALLEEYGE